jgi:hypothetical protein
LRIHEEWLARLRDPALFFFRQDLEKVGIMDSSGESGERPYRPVPDGPAVPGWEGPARFAIISLDVLCHGVKIKRRWRDYGTVLSKSSVAEAIKEALESGILVRKRRRSSSGRDLSSLYAINWDRVQEYDWQRSKKVSIRRTP